MSKWMLLLPLLFLGCGSRGPAAIPDASSHSDPDGSGLADGAAHDAAADTTKPTPDAATVSPDAGPLPFCTGSAPKVQLDNKPLKITGTLSGLGVMASCCPPGEFVSLLGVDAAGQQLKLTLEILRLMGTPAPTAITIDLAKPPKGWLVDVRCEPYQSCGLLRQDTATFKGTLKMTSLLGAPAYQVSLCLDAKPKPTTPPSPYAKPVKLYFDKVVVNTVCVYGMDQDCNADPTISSYRGKCNPDSTCTCLPGAKKTPNGKCL